MAPVPFWERRGNGVPWLVPTGRKSLAGRWGEVVGILPDLPSLPLPAIGGMRLCQVFHLRFALMSYNSGRAGKRPLPGPGLRVPNASFQRKGPNDTLLTSPTQRPPQDRPIESLNPPGEIKLGVGGPETLNATRCSGPSKHHSQPLSEQHQETHHFQEGLFCAWLCLLLLAKMALKHLPLAADWQNRCPTSPQGSAPA